jgi:hypothetical protein
MEDPMKRTHALAAAVVAMSLAACNDAVDNRITGSEPASALTSLTTSNLRKPGAPTTLRYASFSTTKPHTMSLADAERDIAAFDRARTTRGLAHLAARGLAALEHGWTREAATLRRQLYLEFNRASQSVQPSFTFGYAGNGECLVDFDDHAILSGFPDDAQSTFTSPPHWVQSCGQGEVRVEPTVYSHYHVVYEDHTIDCIDQNGDFGRGDPGDCDALDDPADEPRYLGSHVGDESIRIRYFSGGSSQPFTMHSFVNLGSTSVRFRYRKNGVWYEWASLAGGWVWDVSDWVVGVTEVRITNTHAQQDCGLDWEAAFPGAECDSDFSPFFLDDFSISPG